MQGFVQLIPNCLFDLDVFSYCVISRRSKHRAGLRYERRGIDGLGRVANFVETEMIVSVTINNVYQVASFVQVRGSSKSISFLNVFIHIFSSSVVLEASSITKCPESNSHIRRV